MGQSAQVLLMKATLCGTWALGHLGYLGYLGTWGNSTLRVNSAGDHRRDGG